METTTDTTAVERELTIAASPETVWEFLVDPDKAVRWMGTVAEFDARPGGEYRVEVLSGNVARGVFVVLDPPRRLVWTWGWEPGSRSSVTPGASTIEIDLEPEGNGTRLRFAHRGLPDEDAAQNHGQGWDHYFERLAVVARGDDPGRDTWLDDRT